MSTRGAHLVGSLPGGTAEEAMRTALEVLGPHLRSLPDGETGPRRNWIISAIESLRHHRDLEVAKDGDWSDYDRTPRLRIRKGHRLYGVNLDFGHVAAARDSMPVFERLRAEHGRPDLAFQSGVPGDLDMTMFTLGPAGLLRHRRPFTEATLAEIRGVRELAGPNTIFQIEVPVELVLLAKTPARALRPAAARMARVITGLAAAAVPGSRFGVHLCLGDMNNRPFGTLADLAPLVALTNALVRRWPAHQALVYLHAPFAAADQPAPVEAGYYRPLAALSVPAEVGFAAGFAHEKQSLADQRAIRDAIESQLGRAVDIAAACGLGRRSAVDGRRVLERTRELLDD